MYSGYFSFASGYEMAQQMIATVPRPTAVFATNNFVANGALEALRGNALDVPGDMAVVCFDELPMNIVGDPFLTAIAQPAYELGQEAARLLIAQLKGGSPGRRQEVILPTELIVRASSGEALG